ncbi:unnamed protein product, partial [Dicrocoelium dendriticum]
MVVIPVGHGALTQSVTLLHSNTCICLSLLSGLIRFILISFICILSVVCLTFFAIITCSYSGGEIHGNCIHRSTLPKVTVELNRAVLLQQPRSSGPQHYGHGIVRSVLASPYHPSGPFRDNYSIVGCASHNLPANLKPSVVSDFVTPC